MIPFLYPTELTLTCCLTKGPLFSCSDPSCPFYQRGLPRLKTMVRQLRISFSAMREVVSAIPCRARSLLTAVAVLGIALPPTPLCATEYTATPDSYLERLRQLKAGDRLLLQPGEYQDGLKIQGLQGTPRAQIMLHGPASGAPAIFLGRENANTVSIKDSAYVVIRNLVLDGQDLPVDAVKAEGRSNWAHHITLEHLFIVNHGNDQQVVGINTQSPAWNWVIRHNVILGAGTGIYLGSSDGRQPFVHGIIEHNLILDTIGYNLQIKHQKQRPTIVALPIASGETIIRGNIFMKGNRSSGGRMARPNVLVGHFPASGPGMEDRYLIEGNIFLGNPGESLFQGEGNITLLHNLFINPFGNGIAIQPHHATPRRIEVARNFVATQGFSIRVRGTDSRFPASLYDNETVDMSGPAWAKIDDGKNQAVAHLKQTVVRWLTTGAPDDREFKSATPALRQALSLVCGEHAKETVPTARRRLSVEIGLLCDLVPQP